MSNFYKLILKSIEGKMYIKVIKETKGKGVNDMDYKDMKIDDIIKRVNELYKKSKEEGLSEEEKVEQEKIRRVYIDNVKANFQVQLDGVKPNNPVKPS